MVRHSGAVSRLPMRHSVVYDRILCSIAVTVIGEGGSAVITPPYLVGHVMPTTVTAR
jgi:hypothetical protein